MAQNRTRGQFGPWGVVVFLSAAFVINYIDREVVFAIFRCCNAICGFRLRNWA
jgi:hypothetical protein